MHKAFQTARKNTTALCKAQGCGKYPTLRLPLSPQRRWRRKKAPTLECQLAKGGGRRLRHENHKKRAGTAAK
jgi:hypothetical protein